jgi:hypothetical protein
MTRAQIAAMIAGIGLPYAYDHFTKKDSPGGPPFIAFMYPNNDDLYADNVNYARITALHIELYTDNVDFDLESRVEAALTAAELPFSKIQTYIENESMCLTTYDTEVYLNA